MAPLLAAALPTLFKALPKLAGLFKGNKAADAVQDVLNIGKDVLGLGTEDEVLQALAQDPQQLRLFQEAVMADKYRLDEMYLGDKANARDMQKAALAQDDLFSKRFIYYLAIWWSFFAAIYIGCVSFLTIAPENVPLVHTILGFLLGTVVSGIIQFFFGSSKGSQDKTSDSKAIMTLLTDKVNEKKV
jgi:hypothetical protein